MSEAGMQRYCLYCGGPISESATIRRQYCSERCRRQAQNARRIRERALEAAASRGLGIFMQDPWSKPDLWDVERMWELSLMEAFPAQ